MWILITAACIQLQCSDITILSAHPSQAECMIEMDQQEAERGKMLMCIERRVVDQ